MLTGAALAIYPVKKITPKSVIEMLSTVPSHSIWLFTYCDREREEEGLIRDSRHRFSYEQNKSKEHLTLPDINIADPGFVQDWMLVFGWECKQGKTDIWLEWHAKAKDVQDSSGA